MTRALALSLVLLLGMAGAVHAYDFNVNGYVDGELQAVQANKDLTDNNSSSEWNNSFGNQSEVLLFIGTDPSEDVSLVSEIAYRQAFNDIDVWQAMVNWMASGEQLQMKAGKFWFPYGIEHRYAYSTVNPLVSRPFETHSSGRLLEVKAPMSLARSWQDQGAGVHGKVALGQSDMNLMYDLAVSNGLSGMSLTPATPDNNDNKTFGGMVSLMPAEGVEVGGSFAYGKYDTGGHNNYMLAGGHAVYSMIENLDVMGEFRYGSVDSAGIAGADLSEMLFYGTVSYKIPMEGIEYVEPAVRFGWFDPNTDSASSDDTFMQVAFGLNVSPAEHFALKGEFQLNKESVASGATEPDNNELLFQAVLGW